MNRGNYQREVFETVGAAQAFEAALAEACDRYGWLIHADVVMRNHYHLALETPEAKSEKHAGATNGSGRCRNAGVQPSTSPTSYSLRLGKLKWPHNSGGVSLPPTRGLRTL